MVFIEILKEQWLKSNKYLAMSLCSTVVMIWILPSLIHHFVYTSTPISEISFFICFVALFFLLLQTFFHTLSNLQQLYQHRDIALYVPIALWKVICSRLINSICIHTLVLCIILFSMMLTLLHVDAYSIQHIMAILALLFFVLLYGLITVVAIALLAFPLWHVCRYKLGLLTYMIFPFLVIGAMYVVYTFENSAFYRKYIAFGIKYSDFIPMYETTNNKYFNIETFYKNVYMLEDTFIFVFTIICYTIGIHVTKRILTK